jgi:hypothetical protein
VRCRQGVRLLHWDRQAWRCLHSGKGSVRGGAVYRKLHMSADVLRTVACRHRAALCVDGLLRSGLCIVPTELAAVPPGQQ